jgi:Skp family chaperone for outer membrane proteins
MKALLMMVPVAALPVAYAFMPAAQAPATRPPSTVRFVSPQRVFNETTGGKAEIARIQALQQQKATELRTRQQTLDTTRQQLSQATDAAARTQLQQQEQTQRADLERATLQAQADLQGLQRQVQANVLGLVKTALDDITKGQHIDLVLNADQAVVWSMPGMDLTNPVIERLNAKPAAEAPKK